MLPPKGVSKAAVRGKLPVSFLKLVQTLQCATFPPMYRLLQVLVHPVPNPGAKILAANKQNEKSASELVAVKESIDAVLLQVDKAYGLDLLRDAKRSVNRDFKINS